MPRIKDNRVIQAKKAKYCAIRKEFQALMEEGRTYEYAINKLIAKYGYAESTLYQIIKQFGNYKQ